jgi:hypothetical protein
MIKLEGKYYRTADGRKVGPIKNVHGNFVVLVDSPAPYYRTVTTDPHALPSRLFVVAEWTDEPKAWRNMTDAEKGALLLAHHEGKVIEQWIVSPGYSGWVEHLPPFTKQPFRGGCAYRVRPEPKRETVRCWWDGYDIETFNGVACTHRITFETIDGEPDTSSIKMEKL